MVLPATFSIIAAIVTVPKATVFAFVAIMSIGAVRATYRFQTYQPNTAKDRPVTQSFRSLF